MAIALNALRSLSLIPVGQSTFVESGDKKNWQRGFKLYFFENMFLIGPTP
jgi:hypothetical protein